MLIIHMKQNTNFFVINSKVQGLNILMILKLLLNIPLTRIIFMNVSKNGIILIAFDDNIVDTLSITKFNQ